MGIFNTAQNMINAAKGRGGPTRQMTPLSDPGYTQNPSAQSQVMHAGGPMPNQNMQPQQGMYGGSFQMPQGMPSWLMPPGMGGQQNMDQQRHQMMLQNNRAAKQQHMPQGGYNQNMNAGAYNPNMAGMFANMFGGGRR